MLVLALDTATAVCSVALARDSAVLAEITSNLPSTHSQRLLPMVDSLFTETGLKPTQLDLLAVSRGPGSFTGLRLGIATVKGLGLALNLPVVGVSTLEVLAHNFSGGLVCPVLNARLGQVYAALYRTGPDSQPTCLLPDQAISIPDLLLRLKEEREPIWFCGDGAELILPVAGKLASPHRAPMHLLGNRAGALADLARNRQGGSADAITPLYLRDSQAEVQLRQRQAGVK